MHILHAGGILWPMTYELSPHKQIMVFKDIRVYNPYVELDERITGAHMRECRAQCTYPMH